MNKIAIVTDSTAYLTNKEINKLGVAVVPLPVCFDTVFYREGVEISDKDFFTRVQEAETLPTSSQPAVGELLKVYEDLAKEYDAIISIHISDGISGTFQTVSALAEEYQELNIYPVDSTVTSEPQAYLVREAVKMTQKGIEAEKIVERLEYMTEQMGIYFVVDDMTNLIKGGRVSKSVGNIASFLNIKPVLTFEDGKIILYNKVRTQKKAIKQMKKLFTKAVEQTEYPIKASIVHVHDEELGKHILEEFENEFPEVDFHLGYIGAVIGTHVGENTFGITWTIDFDKMI